MNRITSLKRILLLSFLLTSSFLMTAQLECSLRMLEDGETFGVFVRPAEGLTPSRYAVTGTGQITVVVPHGFQITNFQTVNGQWIPNARVDAPVENPEKDYISVGFSIDEPTIPYIAAEETLLFSFQNESAMTESLYLIDNETDPLAQIPNSVHCNPGNELSVFDAGNNRAVYRFFNVYESETLPFARANGKE